MKSAVWWKRLLACMLDAVLFTVLIWVVHVAMGMLMPFVSEGVRFLIRYVPFVTWSRTAAVLSMGVPILCFIFYFLVPVLAKGSTLGGRILGLTIVVYNSAAEVKAAEPEVVAVKKVGAAAENEQDKPRRTRLRSRFDMDDDEDEDGAQKQDATADNGRKKNDTGMPLHSGVLYLSGWIVFSVFMLCLGMSWMMPKHTDVWLTVPGILLFLVVAHFLVDGVFVLMHKEHRSLRDIYAKTIVVSTATPVAKK